MPSTLVRESALFWLATLAACAHAPVCELTPQRPYLVMPDTTASGSLRGVVVALPDSTPISNTQVLVNGGQLFAMTDSTGHFALTGGQVGSVTMRVQMIDYRPVQFQLILPTDHGLRLTVGMVPFCFPIHAVAN